MMMGMMGHTMIILIIIIIIVVILILIIVIVTGILILITIIIIKLMVELSLTWVLGPAIILLTGELTAIGPPLLRTIPPLPLATLMYPFIAPRLMLTL